MINIVIIIFILSILASFGILSYSAWEVRTGVRAVGTTPTLKISFKKVEKYALYTAKHVLQSLVITAVKYWFLAVAKTKKWLANRWPKMRKILKKESTKSAVQTKPTFISRSILESKVKIKRMKERIKKDHEIK